MPVFQYQALTAGGRLMKGTIEAGSAEQARQMLAEMRLQDATLELAALPTPRSRVGRAELLLFNQQLASITRAGVSLERGLREIAADIEKPSMRALVTDLAADLQSGMSVEQAFERRQGLFPPLYGHIVKAGVQSGRLAEMLTSLNRHLEMEGQTRRILLEAITYPLVVLTLASILLTAIFIVVIPPFRWIFTDFDSNLPYLTKVFLDIADHVIPFWATVGLIVAGVVVLFRVLALSPGGRRSKEAFYFRLPVLGRLIHRSLMSRMSDAMALLVGAGCGLPTAARLAFSATGSQTFVTEGERLAENLERGLNIVEAGAFCPNVPPLFFYSMQAGYQRNELQDNLYSLCDMYTQQAHTHQSRLQGLLLPLLIVAVGGVVGMAVMAMFLPMVGLLQAMQGSH